MEYIYVNKLLKTPIYKQIAMAVKKAIDDGILSYNDKLPTEKEICHTYSISPTVVKMAYDQLIKEGQIKRIKGKGTYVTNRFFMQTPINEFYHVDKHIFDQNLPYARQIIMIDYITEDVGAYRMLKIAHGDPCYVLMRVIKANNNPVVLQKIYLPEKYFPKLEKMYHQNDRLYDIFETKYPHKIKHLHNTFSPINASSAEALLLKINPDDAIYFVRSKALDDQDRVIAYITNYFPGEFSEFEVMVHAL